MHAMGRDLRIDGKVSMKCDGELSDCGPARWQARSRISMPPGLRRGVFKLCEKCKSKLDQSSFSFRPILTKKGDPK